jgi:hypothetical protein
VLNVEAHMNSFEQVERAADSQMLRLFIKDCWKSGKGTGWIMYYESAVDRLKTEMLVSLGYLTKE